MGNVTLEQLNKDVQSLQQEVSKIKEMLEEDSLELSEEAKAAIRESRNRSPDEFKTQEEIEKKFL